MDDEKAARAHVRDEHGRVVDVEPRANPWWQTWHAGDKILFRFSPSWTIDYIDPALLASLKEWLRSP